MGEEGNHENDKNAWLQSKQSPGTSRTHLPLLELLCPMLHLFEAIPLDLDPIFPGVLRFYQVSGRVSPRWTMHGLRQQRTVIAELL